MTSHHWAIDALCSLHGWHFRKNFGVAEIDAGGGRVHGEPAPCVRVLRYHNLEIPAVKEYSRYIFILFYVFKNYLDSSHVDGLVMVLVLWS